MSNKNHMSISHRLGDTKTLPLPPAHPYRGAIFLKIESLHLRVQGKPPMENEVA